MKSHAHRRIRAFILVAVLGLSVAGCKNAAEQGVSIGIRQGVGAVTNTLVIGLTDILANAIAQIGGTPQE